MIVETNSCRNNMHSRILPILLAAVLLAVCTACSTTGPVGEADTGPKLPPVVDSSSGEEPDKRYDIQRDPSERSVAEIAELSNSMPDYQPEVALEILRSLESIPSRQLTSMIEGQLEDPEFTEWLELSLLARTTLISGRPVAAAAQHWADYHYGHPVTRENFPELLEDYNA
jgi:hypothetical protein